MQIGAINSINFKANNYNQETNYKDTETIAMPALDEDLQDTYDKAKKEASGNVSLVTCFIGALTALGVAKKGSKFVGNLRGAAAEGGKAITEGAYKLFKKNAPDAQESLTHIGTFFDKFTNKTDIASESTTTINRFVATINSIFGKGSDEAATKGEKILEKLHNQNVYLNKRSLFDNLIAGIAAYGVADGASDITEGIIDKNHVENEVGEHAARKAETMAKVKGMLSQAVKEAELDDILAS